MTKSKQQLFREVLDSRWQWSHCIFREAVDKALVLLIQPPLIVLLHLIDLGAHARQAAARSLQVVPARHKVSTCA
jgi:hypothetical protein